MKVEILLICCIILVSVPCLADPIINTDNGQSSIIITTNPALIDGDESKIKVNSAPAPAAYATSINAKDVTITIIQETPPLKISVTGSPDTALCQAMDISGKLSNATVEIPSGTYQQCSKPCSYQCNVVTIPWAGWNTYDAVPR